MSKETTEQIGSELEPRQRRAVAELMETIRGQYPSATFRVRAGVDDPEATYLVAMVDEEDPDVVLDLVVDRLLELQLDEHLPINVLPIHPPELVAQTRQRLARRLMVGSPLSAPLPT